MRALPFVCLALVLTACAPAQPPRTRETVHLRGTPYERGLEHGTRLRSKVRSFYGTLMTNSLFPYLSREQPDIASLLTEYSADRYKDGAFAYELLLDSAKSVERTLPRAVRDELRGVADGSGLTYEQVLVLNTFVDSVLATRGVALAIRQAKAPIVESFQVLGCDADGADNDGDGMIDEVDEGLTSPFISPVGAVAVEVPQAARFRVVLSDPDGLSPTSIRMMLGGRLYTADDGALELVSLAADRLQVTLTPAEPLVAGETVSLVVSAGDAVVQQLPPPEHLSFMRDEELVLTVKGAGLTPGQVLRPRQDDGRTRPPSVAFGVRGSVTADGSPLLAHHFALLDANTSHKHGVVLVHHPESGVPFVTVGWAGVVYGFSGLSARGVGYACNPADTLDNSVIGSVLEQVAELSQAKLLATGTPMGFLGRRILENATDVASAREVLTNAKHVYGWTCLLSDKSGGLEAVEVDSDIFKEGQGGVYSYGPADLDANLNRYASVTDDDLLAVSAYARNVNDIARLTIAGQRIAPQRSWSSFYYRSRRALDAMKRKLEAGRGTLTVEAAKAMLGDPELVDASDSMNAVVLEVRALKLHTAMGQVPATQAPFETLDLAAEVTP